jgi:hypothetical protein
VTDRELIQQWMQPGAIVPVDMNTVRILLDALRLAIEQAARQEPVAWFWFDERDGGEWIHIADSQINANKFGNAKVIPLYIAPPQRQPLTEASELEAAVAAEREACAKVAEDGLIGHTIANAIRARGEKK